VREDVVLRSLGPDAPMRRIWLARQDGGYTAPAVAPMSAILHDVAEEHCFTCDALVGGARLS
jgi:hypothetical protein